MVIQVDTRQKKNHHKQTEKWFAENGIKTVSGKLLVGDYAIPSKMDIVVDTKADLNELISNVCQQHERFRRELLRAKECGIKLVILCEHGDGIKTLEDVYFYQNPRKHEVRWKTVNGKRVKDVISSKAVDGNQLYKSLCTIRDRYSVDFIFCQKEETGRKIIEILGGAHD